MHQYIKLLINYSKKANDSVISIFKKLSSDELYKDRGSFMKSLFGLMDHIVEGENYFIRQLETAYPDISFLKHKYSRMESKYNEINFTSLDEMADALMTSDQCIAAFIDSIKPEMLNDLIEIESFNGKKSWTVTYLLLQLINHSIHHRGQISQILDEMGIVNDYSGLPVL